MSALARLTAEIPDEGVEFAVPDDIASGVRRAAAAASVATAVRRSGVIVRPYVGPTHLIPDSSDSVVQQSWTIDPNGPGYRAVCIR